MELGLPHAWWRTAIDVIRAPTATFRASGEERSIRGSLLFAMLSYFVGLCTMMPVAVLGARAQVEGRPEYEVALGLFSPWTLAALGMAAYVLFQLAHPFFDHLALRLVGARPRPLAVTIRAWALAQGPFLLGAIPLCGWYVAPAWTVVTRVLAYRELHGTTSLRAFIAYLLGAILLAVTVTLALGLVVLMAGWSARNLG